MEGPAAEEAETRAELLERGEEPVAETRSAGRVGLGRGRQGAGLPQVEPAPADRELVAEDAALRDVRPDREVRPVDGHAAGERMLRCAPLPRAREVAQREGQGPARARDP